MHPYKRSTRLNILLREEIADIILHRVNNPHLGFITVTDVALTADLKIARVYISVLDPEQQAAALEILSKAKAMIRSEVATRVRMKFIPTLEFRIDSSIEEGFKIDRLLNEIKTHHSDPADSRQ
jgi:ribosome-binding factor A